jgi:hypothetical protein
MFPGNMPGFRILHVPDPMLPAKRSTVTVEKAASVAFLVIAEIISVQF